MPLDVSSPVVVSEAGEWKIVGIHQVKMNGLWTTHLSCQLIDDGKVTNAKVIEISADKYNAWWGGYLTGTFLDICVANAMGLPAPAANSQESYYLNP